LGEVAGLNASLQAAAQKLAGLDSVRDRRPNEVISPVIGV
jgi:hypothetical protein